MSDRTYAHRTEEKKTEVPKDLCRCGSCTEEEHYLVAYEGEEIQTTEPVSAARARLNMVLAEGKPLTMASLRRRMNHGE